MNKPKPRSRAADNAALRARRKEQGLVHYREWVTPEEKEHLIKRLAELREKLI
jgi:NifB/MoaA-like Fe-S oxidoreductase